MTSTTSRLLELLSLLQTRRDWPGSLLAERLNTSDRTVRRDIERLREMGYRIEATMGPEGGYRLGSGSELPPLLFDDEQTVAVAVALQTAPAAGARIEEGAIRALATIRQVMPSRLRHRLDALEVTAIIGRAGSGTPARVSSDVLVSLAATIRAREVLRLDYAARDAVSGEAPLSSRRRVEPHRIVTQHGHWHLLAWDLDRQDWRLFSIDRVSPRTPTGPRFAHREVPGGDVHEFVAARFKGRDVNEWPCRGTVILDLPATEVLPFAGEGTVRAIGEGRCSLETGSWSWGSLAASFGRFEVTMEIAGPPELADAFAVLAARYQATAQTLRGDVRLVEGRSNTMAASNEDMTLTTALSVVAVSDLAKAREFYTNLFGRGPDLEPMPTLAQWDIAGGGGVQVVEQPENSGSSMVTLLVTDFDDYLEELHEKDVDHGEVILGVISRVTQASDPAGNIITFAESTAGP